MVRNHRFASTTCTIYLCVPIFYYLDLWCITIILTSELNNGTRINILRVTNTILILNSTAYIRRIFSLNYLIDYHAFPVGPIRSSPRRHWLSLEYVNDIVSKWTLRICPENVGCLVTTLVSCTDYNLWTLYSMFHSLTTFDGCHVFRFMFIFWADEMWDFLS